MTNKLIRISTTGVERVRTGAASMFHKQVDDSSLSEASSSSSTSPSAAETDVTLLTDNTTPSPATAGAGATSSPVVVRKCPKKKTHILNVEMSNVVPENDSSFEVQVENELVISELVISSQDSLDHHVEEEETDVSCEEEEEESAVEVIYN
mmetsp:Transcript_28953/g.46989  ORF Transcript_28953/g.46989 Transcript_28953/m.46989 type:complete len:151 (-) Transcript_28953:68-520(-)